METYHFGIFIENIRQKIRQHIGAKDFAVEIRADTIPPLPRDDNIEIAETY